MRRTATALFLSLLWASAQPVLAHVPAHEEGASRAVAEEVVWLDAATGRVLAAPPASIPDGIASYGPFRVLDAERAALVDVTDENSPAALAAMLRDYPGIAEIEMVECPGTDDDKANLRLGRMIRARAMATHVPAGGSVRSGAVEIFLAGAERRIDNGAEFAVHAWMDEDGLQAADYPANAPENRKYLAYYSEMGMTGAQAAAFYAMTNSAPFEHALWLDAATMRRWAGVEQAPEAPPAQLQLANLDLSHSLR